ncbi:MAG: hypothetical protein B6I31_05105 [Desulfobacteraceae bacterium 4572_19]|nr:MAG: hypothetical protein B6I31_05105 [Desulfobacteraceae bacterium 4572_19]
MNGITAFSFKSGNTFVHRIDIRLKLFLLVLCSALSLNCFLYGLVLLTTILVATFFYIKVGFVSTIKELYYILLLLAFVFISRSLSIEGTPIIQFWFISITYEGVISGAFFCWRLSLVILVGLLFTATTKVSQIKSGIQWFFTLIPFIPEKRIALMISLLMGFIPVILNKIYETNQAQRARCIENRKNPVYRYTKLLIPTLHRTFESADKLVLAMEARCYESIRNEDKITSTT